MSDKEKQKYLIFGSIIVAVIVLFLLFRRNPVAPATVIEQQPAASGFDFPSFSPININGGDPRLIYTPSQMSGISLPPFMLDSIGSFLPNFSTATLPDNDSPENNQSGSGACSTCSTPRRAQTGMSISAPLYFS